MRMTELQSTKELRSRVASLPLTSVSQTTLRNLTSFGVSRKTTSSWLFPQKCKSQSSVPSAAQDSITKPTWT